MYEALVDDLDEERTPAADEAVDESDKATDVDELDEVEDDLGELDSEQPEELEVQADEILAGGDGQIRALLSVGGNPVAAWPDQLKTIEALDSLELLVHVDPFMSATARRAQYIIAPKLSLEMPSMTSLFDMLSAYAPGYGWNQPHAQYTPAVVDPPAGSDLIAEWELFFGLAQ